MRSLGTPLIRPLILGLIVVLGVAAVAPRAEATVQLTNSEGMHIIIDNVGASQGALIDAGFIQFKGLLSTATVTYTYSATYTTPSGATYLTPTTYVPFYYLTTFAYYPTTTYTTVSGTYLTTTTALTGTSPYSTTVTNFFTNPISAVFSNAYDRAYLLTVTVQGGSGPNPFGVINRMLVEENGRELAFEAENVDGVDVWRKVYVPANDVWVRHTVFLENTTDVSKFVTVNISGNLGSDAATRILRTRSGDTTFKPADRWAVTSAVNTCCIPHLFHNIDGPGGELRVAQITFPGGGVDTFSWEWQNHRILPKRMIAFAFYVGGRLSSADALGTAQRLDTTPPELGDGMHESERRAVQNWVLQRDTFADFIQGSNDNFWQCEGTLVAFTSSQTAVNTAILLLPALGLWGIRRRRR